MKYRVNNACIGCGFCAATCPDIFRMNGDRRPSPPTGKFRRSWKTLPRKLTPAARWPLSKR